MAMIMYEDNAQLINETLAAIAPTPKLHTIALGRIDAMLSIRRWLDEGGLAGLLADRTLPVGNPQRSKAIVLPFLGAPAYFADGPFRLAAHAAPQGRVHGRPLPRRPRLRSALRRAGRFRRPSRCRRRGGRRARRGGSRAAMARYVATLEALCREAPYNWFNFYDFWADAETPTCASAAP